jgi:hypothetical protein
VVELEDPSVIQELQLELAELVDQVEVVVRQMEEVHLLEEQETLLQHHHLKEIMEELMFHLQRRTLLEVEVVPEVLVEMEVVHHFWEEKVVQGLQSLGYQRLMELQVLLPVDTLLEVDREVPLFSNLVGLGVVDMEEHLLNQENRELQTPEEVVVELEIPQ